VKEPNDYLAITRKWVQTGLRHMDDVKTDLDRNQEQGTHSRSLTAYTGEYQNEIGNFTIGVTEKNGKLQMCFQGSEYERYDLHHYQDDTFSWWMPYDEAAKRGRYINDFASSYYLIHFQALHGDEINALKWAWDTADPNDLELFTSFPA